MLVSIIIPIYNVAPYIEKCLLSVINQTYTNFEVLLIDDCGSDNSIQIVQFFLSNYRDNRFRIIHHERNRGLSAARNTGINEAKGEYLYFLDSDDSITADCIALLLKPTQLQPYEMIVGNVQTVGLFPSISFPTKKSLTSNNEIIEYYLSHKYYVMAWNKLVLTKFIRDNELYFLEGIYHEDLLWSFETALKLKRLYFCEVRTYYYLIRENSIVTSFSEQNIKDLVVILKKIVGYKMMNNVTYYSFLESYKFSILTKTMSKKQFVFYKKQILEISPSPMKKIFSPKLKMKTRIQILILAMPNFLAYNLLHLVYN